MSDSMNYKITKALLTKWPQLGIEKTTVTINPHNQSITINVQLIFWPMERTVTLFVNKPPDMQPLWDDFYMDQIIDAIYRQLSEILITNNSLLEEETWQTHRSA